MSCKNNCIENLYSSVLSENPTMNTYQAFCSGMVNALGNLWLIMQDPENSEKETMAMMAHMLYEASDALVPEGEDPEDFSIVQIDPTLGSENYH